MDTNELLQAISDMMDQKLEPINERLDRLEMQVKRSERNLKADIIESENLILEEVSRVHHILIDHVNDKSVHTA